MLNPTPNLGGFAARQPMLAGVCARLADDFGLSAGSVRIVMLVGAILPTGITYLALAWLAGERRSRPSYATAARPPGMPGSTIGRECLAVRQRFGALEARLGAIEAFVSSKDFELHKGFRHMRD